MRAEDIAMICHEANRAYCWTHADMSQPSWCDAPEWQRESAVNGVRMHLSNPKATPENSHESWMAEKQAAGWKFGPVKDPGKKEHPCFRPYNELPADQQAKDHLFRNIVHALAPFVVGEPVVVAAE